MDTLIGFTNEFFEFTTTSTTGSWVAVASLFLFVLWRANRVWHLKTTLHELTGEERTIAEEEAAEDEEAGEDQTYSPGRQRELESQLSRLQPALAMSKTQEVKLRSKIARAVAAERQQRALNRDIIAKGEELAEDCDEEIAKAQAVMDKLLEERADAMAKTAELEEYAAELQYRLDKQHVFHTKTATSVRDDAEITEGVVRDCLESNHEEAVSLLKLRDELIESNEYLTKEAEELAEESANLAQLILDEEVAAAIIRKRLDEKGLRCLETAEEVQAIKSLLEENTRESLTRAIGIMAISVPSTVSPSQTPQKVLTAAAHAASLEFSETTSATADEVLVVEEQPEEEQLVAPSPESAAALVLTPAQKVAAEVTPLRPQSINTTPFSAGKSLSTTKSATAPSTPVPVAAEVKVMQV